MVLHSRNCGILSTGLAVSSRRNDGIKQAGILNLGFYNHNFICFLFSFQVQFENHSLKRLKNSVRILLFSPIKKGAAPHCNHLYNYTLYSLKISVHYSSSTSMFAAVKTSFTLSKLRSKG